MPAWFYILRLQSTHLYCGSTRFLDTRIKHHFAGRACRTTKIDPPIALVYSEQYPSYKEAFRREHQVKRWSRARKESLVSGKLSELRELAKRKRVFVRGELSAIRVASHMRSDYLFVHNTALAHSPLS